MNSRRNYRIISVAIVVVLTLISTGYAYAKSKERTGKWVATSNLGSLTLYVDENGQSVCKIEFNFRCGRVNAKGSIGSEKLSKDWSGWKIDTQGHFAVEKVPFYIDFFGTQDSKKNTLGSLEGTFFQDGKTASGTWILSPNDGTECRGDWSATR